MFCWFLSLSLIWRFRLYRKILKVPGCHVMGLRKTLLVIMSLLTSVPSQLCLTLVTLLLLRRRPWGAHWCNLLLWVSFTADRNDSSSEYRWFLGVGTDRSKKLGLDGSQPTDCDRPPSEFFLPSLYSVDASYYETLVFTVRNLKTRKEWSKAAN